MLLANAESIPLWRLMIAGLPVVLLMIYLWRGGHSLHGSMQGLARMVVQLLGVGYLLVLLFESDSSAITLGALTVMLVASSWIALRSTSQRSTTIFAAAVLATLLGGGSTLAVMILGVLDVSPWYAPKIVIPLAGMSFSACMNGIALAAERFESESARGIDVVTASRSALLTALIPITNSLYAVGVVSIPGMMTGQVLAGVSPLIAARYQIMVMCMIFASSGISVAIFLEIRKHVLSTVQTSASED
jgi:putative ABC transport system permease protein